MRFSKTFSIKKKRKDFCGQMIISPVRAKNQNDVLKTCLLLLRKDKRSIYHTPTLPIGPKVLFIYCLLPYLFVLQQKESIPSQQKSAATEMEGLIPMVYKAIKKTRFRRQYSHLSSEAAQTYNIADFYTDQSHMYMMSSSTEKIGGLHVESNGHRRHKSAGAFAVGFSPAEDTRTEFARPPPNPKQLVRFRSHRLFSCVSGAQKCSIPLLVPM